MTFADFVDVGISVIPHRDYRPAVDWSKYKFELPTMDECKSWQDAGYGVAVVCGAVSGDLICLDFDQKNALAGTDLIKIWSQNVKSIDKYILDRVVLSKTRSGGWHVYYRCESDVGGNTKLAMRLPVGTEKKPVTLIETRGNGGIAYNYPVSKGSFDDLPVLSVDEHEILINSAKMMNEVLQKPVEPRECREWTGITPMDHYCSETDATVVLDMLLKAGWSIDRERGNGWSLIRPGKTKGVSATLNVLPDVFYVFSSSTEFDTEKAYSWAGVLAVLEFGGDFSACARHLAKEGYGHKIEGKEKKELVANILGTEEQLLSEEDKLSVIEGIKTIDDAIDEHIEYVKRGKTFKLSDRFKHIRHMFEDIAPGHVVGIAGSSGSGKSAVMTQILADVCEQSDTYSLFCSLEMPAGDVGVRAMMEFAEPNEDGFVSKNFAANKCMTDGEFRKKVASQYKRMAILDNKYDFETIMHTVKIYKEHLDKQGKCLSIVAVDYFGMLSGSLDIDKQAVISQLAKAWAKKLGISIFLIQQFNASVNKYDTPDTNSISGRRDLYALLDHSFLIWKSRNDPRRMRIQSAKERFNLETVRDLVQIGFKLESDDHIPEPDEVVMPSGNKALAVRKVKKDEMF